MSVRERRPDGLRERLLETAARITAEQGWSAVTMSKVAVGAGVSRQTVYNELGGKPALGQAMVLRELDTFLAVVADELDRHTDIVEAIEAAAAHILEMAAENRLLHVILTSAQSRDDAPGGGNELLPFLTTDAEPLIRAATSVIAEHLPGHQPELTLSAEQLQAAMDAIVRLVLSHVMQPTGPPRQIAKHIAWIAGCVLRS